MSAVVSFSTGIAVIDGYVWTSENRRLADALNSMLDPLGPSGGDPSPDNTAADYVANLFGGTVIEYAKIDTDERVY